MRQLFEKNKDGLYSEIMLREKYKEPPKLPQLNRFSWESHFNYKYGSKTRKFIKTTYPVRKEITLREFEKTFYQKFDKSKWKNNMLDVIYAMEAKPNNLLELTINKGKIQTILVKDKK